MLISGGQALCDDERVCTYAAGTETNPVYLFDKASIEKENAQLCKAYQQNDGILRSYLYVCVYMISYLFDRLCTNY